MIAVLARWFGRFACLLLVGCLAGPMPTAPDTDYDVIVIGAGMGGLSAATHLQHGGMRVLLLEQHHKVGGCTSAFSRGEFSFDVALQEMAGGGTGSRLGQLLQRVGVLDKVELIAIPSLYRSVFPGLDFRLPGNPRDAIAALCRRWPEERQGIEDFFALMAGVYEDINELQEFYRLGPVAGFLRGLSIPVFEWSLAKTSGQNLQQVLDQHFESAGLKAVVGQLWFYYGPPPSELWAPIFLLANQSFLVDGAWHVRGSSQALADAYAARLVELGGELRVGHRVERIDLQGDRVRSVRVANGECFTTRYVVSSADPYQTFFRLLDESQSPASYTDKIKAMQPSNSFVGLYLGLDVDAAARWGIEDHEVFLNTSYDHQAMYQNMMAGHWDRGMASVTFYSNLGDRFYAPPGKSVVVMHAYSDARAWSTDPQRYAEQKSDLRERLLHLLEQFLPDVRGHVEVAETITPLTIQSYTMQHGGTPYGWSFTTDQWQRLANTTPVDGLYLAGAWSRPAHGVAGTQISGYQAARLILDREGRPEAP